MSIVKNESDKLPEELVESRAKTYEGMMNLGYLALLPVTIGIVMFILLKMIGAGWIVSFFLMVLTALGVFAFAKTFFVH